MLGPGRVYRVVVIRGHQTDLEKTVPLFIARTIIFFLDGLHIYDLYTPLSEIMTRL